MIKINNFIFNENEIVKIQFDDGSKEMEIDHTNGNRTFIDGTFDDIKWDYKGHEKVQPDYKSEIKRLEEHNKELVETNYDLAEKLKSQKEGNKILKKVEEYIEKIILITEDTNTFIKDHENANYLLPESIIIINKINEIIDRINGE